MVFDTEKLFSSVHMTLSAPFEPDDIKEFVPPPEDDEKDDDDEEKPEFEFELNIMLVPKPFVDEPIVFDDDNEEDISSRKLVMNFSSSFVTVATFLLPAGNITVN